MAKGWESWVNKTEKEIKRGIVNIKISENSLNKILVLGIKVKESISFSLKF